MKDSNNVTMNIRASEIKDLNSVMGIYERARRFMQAQGNSNQWINGYPSEELIKQEIGNNHSFVCENENGEIVGTFCFIIGDDPTYTRIDNGKWLNDHPYGTIHRLASSGKEKGVSDKCIQWCFTQCKNIRADTHHDNTIMQSILKKHGFEECGIIYISNGTARIAYHKCD